MQISLLQSLTVSVHGLVVWLCINSPVLQEEASQMKVSWDPDMLLYEKSYIGELRHTCLLTPDKEPMTGLPIDTTKSNIAK